MAIFDTDFIVAILRGNDEAGRRYDFYAASGLQLRTTSITVMELLHGAHLHAQSIQKLQDVQKVLDCLEVIPFDTHAARQCALIMAVNKQKKVEIGLPDLQIGSCALAISDFIVTRNLKDFSRIPGLSIEKW